MMTETYNKFYYYMSDDDFQDVVTFVLHVHVYKLNIMNKRCYHMDHIQRWIIYNILYTVMMIDVALK